MRGWPILLIALPLALAGVGNPCVASPTSVTYQIDLAHDGAIAFKQGFAPPLKERWVRNDLGGRISYPVIANRIVFVTVLEKNGKWSDLYALNSKTGETIWQKRVAMPGFLAPASAQGRVFVVTTAGQVEALSADTAGSVLWTAQMARGNAGAPEIANGNVIVGDSDGDVTAFDESTGNVVWTESLGYNATYTSPAYGDGGLLFNFGCEGYLKLDPDTGDTLWHTSGFGCGDRPETAVYFGRHVFVHDDQYDYVLNAKTGDILRTFGTDNTPAFYTDANGKQFEYALYDGILRGFDAHTGNILWSFAGDGQLITAALVINGIVVEGSASGTLYLVDGATGAALWSTNVGSPFESSGPFVGMGAGDGILIVPARYQIAAYAPARRKTKAARQ